MDFESKNALVLDVIVNEKEWEAIKKAVIAIKV